MARKKLEARQQKELEKMVMNGVTPEDISKYFNIAVSSVHNYKRMRKEKGLKVPDIRGKRPVGIKTEEGAMTITSPKSKGPSLELSSADVTGFMKLYINDVIVYVSPKAKSVTILDTEVIVRI